MSISRGTTKSVSRRGAALRTVWADRSGICSPRSADREGASDPVPRRQGGGAIPVLGQGHGGPSVVQRQVSLLIGVQYIDKLLMCQCDAVAGSLHGALLRNAWLDSGYMFCDSSWVLWPYCSYLLREGEFGS